MTSTATGHSYDIVVVGSGPAGSIAVKELTERGLDVLLLEAGPPLTPQHFVPPTSRPGSPFDVSLRARAQAFLGGQTRQTRRSVFFPSSNRFLVNDLQNPYVTPAGAPYLWIRGRVLGGRLNTYGRVLMRMSDLDFRAGSRDGRSPDWPIAYADLEPYYDQVERFIGVYGERDGVAVVPDPVAPKQPFLTSTEQAFKKSVESQWADRHVISWRYAAPNPERTPRGVVAATQTGRLTLRTDAVVRRISVDDRTGRADGVVFVDRRTHEVHEVRAGGVMLCASAIESVRILLNSTSDRFPGGIGNQHGQLGHYFMDQTPSVSAATAGAPQASEPDTSAPADSFYGPAGGVFVPRFANVGDTEQGYARGFSFQGAMGRGPAVEGRAPGGGLMGFGEMLPYYDNSIRLHTRKKDKWGIPAPVIECRMYENEHALLAAQVRAQRELLENAGHRVDMLASADGLDGRTVFPDRNPFVRGVFRVGAGLSVIMGAAIHECGGARMGLDPSSSVLDPDNRVWDCPNVLVTDAASFVTSGSVGPTLTIMALSARAAAGVADRGLS